MPTYEYLCPKCGTVEVEQKISEEPLKVCPTCKEQPVQRQIAQTSFVLKGKGWARDGYSNSSKSRN